AAHTIARQVRNRSAMPCCPSTTGPEDEQNLASREPQSLAAQTQRELYAHSFRAQRFRQSYPPWWVQLLARAGAPEMPLLGLWGSRPIAICSKCPSHERPQEI